MSSARHGLPVLNASQAGPPVDAFDARAQPAFWRSLEEYYGQSASAQPEFPEGAERRPQLDRRTFVKLLGASMALAGVTGCNPSPPSRILPYVRRPAELVPGIPDVYATAMVMDGYATGLVVQTREGRPIKVEGNPDHPASLGAAGVHEQASLLQLYDPYRLRQIMQGGVARGWDDVLSAFGGRAPGGRVPSDGAGLRFLLEPTSSPFRIHWIERLRERYPSARFHFHSVAMPGAREAAALRVFGRRLTPVHDFRRAKVVLSLECDFTAEGPFHLRYARDFADARRIREPSDDMNRLYAVEAMPSPTGSIADHRLRLRSSQIAPFAAALLAELGAAGGRAPAISLEPHARDWMRAIATDLRQHARESLVVAGPFQPTAVHALAYLVNHALGNMGRTESFIEPPIHRGEPPAQDLAALIDAIHAGDARTVMVLGGNPVYASPGDLRLGDALHRAETTLYLGPYANETAAACEWIVPEAHGLESWGDARALDGTLSVIQPLIRPLFAGRTVDEVLSVFAGNGAMPPLDVLRDTWLRELFPRYGRGAAFDAFWNETLRLGFVPNSAAPRVAAEPSAAAAAWAVGAAASTPAPQDRIEVTFRPDPALHDGRFSNNAWLLELPDPTTKLTWDNAALMSPATADRLDVAGGDVVRIETEEAAVLLPAFPVPGHADDAITLRLGFGRQGAEETAAGHGVDVFPLWPHRSPARTLAAVSRVVEDGGRVRRVELAGTQTHWSMEGRDIVLHATLDEYRRDTEFTHRLKGPVESLYRGPPLDAREQWAMTIDLSVCTGCSACVVACQAENNIPVVGKQGVLDGREMHWLRIDRYQTGQPAAPEVVHQPMLCQHCESAPCEYVCPVNATVHSDDGLNEMIYNRCIGTRFCSNNCPYKVRRFNWFDYNAGRGDVDSLVLNPDVTVRERGVMEKCTYCVQRIRRAGRRARIEGRAIRRGEVETACQQACPTNAIAFGSLTDADSEVVATRREPRSYSVLHELGTEPRTQYSARITNPNPALPREAPPEQRPL